MTTTTTTNSTTTTPAAAEGPLISIVMPCFNQAPYVERSIRSVLEQDYPHKELIVIDGGSTDGSAEVIAGYGPRLAYWVSERDAGQTNALNKGFRLARGEVCAWLNSDDTYPPGTFAAVAAEFRRDPSLDVVYGDQYHVDEADRVVGETRYTRVWYPMLPLLGNVLPQPPAFWKRRLFEEVGFLDESLRFAMDLEFMCRVARVARTRHIRRFTSMFRIHPGQKTNTIHDVGLAEASAVRRRHAAAACAPLPAWLVRPVCQVVRPASFVLQGDARYVWRGVARRFRGAVAAALGAGRGGGGGRSVKGGEPG